MPDPIDLVVHLGSHLAHVAGIRRQLLAARVALAGRGIHVPDLRDHPQPWRNLAWELSDDRRYDERVSNWRGVVAAARSARASAVFVTSEEFETSLRGDGARARLRRIVDELGGRLRLVAVMRDHASYLNIVYATRAANLETPRSFAEFVDEPEPAEQFSYARTLAEPLDVADNGRYLDINSVERAGGLPALLGAVDIDPAGIDVPPLRRDRVPGALAVEVGLLVGRLLRARGRPVTDAERKRADQLRAEVKEAMQTTFPAYWGWTEQLLAEHHDRFNADASAFTARTGATIPSPPVEVGGHLRIVDLHPSAFAALVDGAHAIASGTAERPGRTGGVTVTPTTPTPRTARSG